MTTTQNDIEEGMSKLSTTAATFSYEEQFDPSTVKPDYRELEANSAKSAPKPYKIEECAKCIVIIEGLPKVDEKKEEKLLAVLKKNIFTPSKATLLPSSILVPRLQDSKLSQGYMFAEFATPSQAASVIQIANGYKLDKNHVLFSYSLDDVDRVMNEDSEDGAEKEDETFKEEPFVENEFFNEWLCDSKARDQFLTLAANGSATITWGPRGAFGSGQQLEKVHDKASWADVSMQWSSRGTLLSSLHKQGIMLWAGESFKLLHRFPHPNVRLLSFSPNDRYMVSWSPIIDVEDNVMLWDTQTARLIRSFKLGLDDPAAGQNDPSTVKWPLMKFNADDTVLSRTVAPKKSTVSNNNEDSNIPSFDLLSYALPSMTPLKDMNGSTRIENVSDFQPSPTDPDHLIYWTVGTANTPSRLTLLSLKDLSPIKSKNIFNVLEASIHFQDSGSYCGILVKRHIGKNKNKQQTSLEIFNIPLLTIETLDLSSFDGDSIVASPDVKVQLLWEPRDGHRFMVAKANPSLFKTDITFYSMKGGSSPQKLEHIERKIVLSSYHWSPRGDNIILMGSEGNSATLEFFSLLDMSTLVEREHFCAAHGEWDPSGRFFASYSSILTRPSDNGFMLWDFRGEQLVRSAIPKMVQFVWRPRPPTLLGKEALRKVKKEMKEFATKFEEADMEEMQSQSSSSTEEKTMQIRLWNEWRRHCIRDYESRNHERRLLIGRDVEWEFEGEDCLLMEWREDRVVAVQNS